MVATSAPFGFRPIYHPSGTPRLITLDGGVASGYASAIYENTPIKYVTGGTIEVSAAGENVLGIFAGVQWNASGRRFIQNFWPASTTYDTGSCSVSFNNDKELEYEVQGSGSFAQTAVGDCADLTGVSGSNFTGISTSMLSTVQGASAQFQINNIAPYSDNAWGDAFTVVRVKIYEYQAVV